MKHTIEGTKEETFADQDECDPVIEDCEVLLNSLREELHLYAQKKGDMVGEIVLVDRGDEIDCSRMGSGGYGIPSIVEPDVIQFKKCDGEVHPARRKRHGLAAVQRGQVLAQAQVHSDARRRPAPARRAPAAAPAAQRTEAARLLPLDNDPWGYYIYSVIKQGSINLAYESQRMAIPDAKFIGLRSKDFHECQLSDSVKISLNDTDRKRAKQIAAYPWFAHKKEWQKEIKRLLDNGFKLEVESLISKDISYVTEQYTPGAAEGEGLAGLTLA